MTPTSKTEFTPLHPALCPCVADSMKDDPSLLGFWPLNRDVEGLDLSKYNAPATLINTTFSSTNPVAMAADPVYLNGNVTSFIQIKNDGLYEVGSFTWSMYFKPYDTDPGLLWCWEDGSVGTFISHSPLYPMSLNFKFGASISKYHHNSLVVGAWNVLAVSIDTAAHMLEMRVNDGTWNRYITPQQLSTTSDIFIGSMSGKSIY